MPNFFLQPLLFQTRMFTDLFIGLCKASVRLKIQLQNKLNNISRGPENVRTNMFELFSIDHTILQAVLNVHPLLFLTY